MNMGNVAGLLNRNRYYEIACYVMYIALRVFKIYSMHQLALGQPLINIVLHNENG